MNLLLHLQPLSHNPDCRDEWMFVESRPIELGEPRVCPCGQTDIMEYYYMNNEKNDNRTWVGSTCIHSIDPNAGRVIAYFKRLLIRFTRGTFRGKDEAGLYWFQVCSNTALVKGALNVVHKYNPPVERIHQSYFVKVRYPTERYLATGHKYQFLLKAKYEQRHLLLTVQTCVYSKPESIHSAKQWRSLLQHHSSSFTSLLHDN